jgi:YopX protein
MQKEKGHLNDEELIKKAKNLIVDLRNSGFPTSADEVEELLNRYRAQEKCKRDELEQAYHFDMVRIMYLSGDLDAPKTGKMTFEKWYEKNYASPPTKQEVEGKEIDENPPKRATGITDKNGKNIYEGDDINGRFYFEGATLPIMGKVVYNEEGHCYCIKNDAGETDLGDCIRSYFEVITPSSPTKIF